MPVLQEAFHPYRNALLWYIVDRRRLCAWFFVLVGINLFVSAWFFGAVTLRKVLRLIIFSSCAESQSYLFPTRPLRGVSFQSISSQNTSFRTNCLHRAKMAPERQDGTWTAAVVAFCTSQLLHFRLLATCFNFSTGNKYYWCLQM